MGRGQDVHRDGSSRAFLHSHSRGAVCGKEGELGRESAETRKRKELALKSSSSSSLRKSTFLRTSLSLASI
jgi:hypothetical protein